MPKTPDEIKKAMLHCSPVSCRSDGCPYRDDTPKYEGDMPVCRMKLWHDMVCLIQQLQAENAEKDKRTQQLERSLSFARDLADGLKAATVKQEQELYVSEERNRQLEAQNAEKDARIQQLEKRVIHLEALNQSNLSVITMQELTRDKLQEQISQLAAERDAAVAGLKSNCTCPECKYFSDDIQDPCRGCKPTDSKFEWRGVQKEE